jgi:acetyl-CoA acyltransferase 1
MLTCPSPRIVNRFCSSGLMAIRSIANQIQAGEIECGLAVGIESMSNHPPETWDFSAEVKGANQEADDCKMPMGWTSENVAGDFKISREKMDAFAARSQQRAAAAQSSGRFDAEIFPITVPDGQGGYKTVRADDGIRAGTTAEALGKIRPAFPDWAPSHTTGGNASQITDGAAGLVLMRRSLANKLGKKVVAKYVATSVSGLPPRIMGIGPALAIPKVLELTGIDHSQVDLYEINEAFSSMAVYCQEKLNIDSDKLNVNGGSTALGHPLGAVSEKKADPLSLSIRIILMTLFPFHSCLLSRLVHDWSSQHLPSWRDVNNT